jgi:L-fuconolactonase
MYMLALRENVYCKLSGMVTEADWTTWSTEDFKIYWDVVLDAFGPSRIMFGSDWPVLTIAATYERWVRTVEEAVSSLTASEQEWIFSRTATQAYKL